MQQLHEMGGCGATHVEHDAKSPKESECPRWLWDLLKVVFWASLTPDVVIRFHLVQVDKGMCKSQAGKGPDQVSSHHS